MRRVSGLERDGTAGPNSRDRCLRCERAEGTHARVRYLHTTSSVVLVTRRLRGQVALRERSQGERNVEATKPANPPHNRVGYED